MPFSLERIFTAALSAPPQANGITEIPPCAPLAPYIRCFWAGDGGKRIEQCRRWKRGGI